MTLLRRTLISVLRHFKNLLVSNDKIRILLYDMGNEKEFGDLYEHEKMLADSVRIDTYKIAIQKLIGPEDVILDLGTGTGILALFAAKQKPQKIYAIDHTKFIDVAREIAKRNGCEDIEFIRCNSRTFKAKEKLDVILHEQMGDYLFNENMIHNILDLKKRLLKPNGRIIPGKFELYLEPTTLEESFNIPFIWENKLHGIDFGFLKENYEALDEFKPADYREQWIEGAAVKQFLCDSKPVLTFDLNTLKSEDEIPHSIELTKQMVRSGSFDGFCLYFKVIFDEEISFDTCPLTEYTHWGNCFFRIESRPCFGGDVVRATLTMRDLLDIRTWSVSVKKFNDKGSKQT